MTTSVLDLLDRWPAQGDDHQRSRWWQEVEDSLRSAPREWVRAVGHPGSEHLSRERAWVLLSWVESSADAIVNQRRAELVRVTAFAMSLLEASPLDRREVMVVALLVRRACTLADLDFLRLVTAGCGQAGGLGEACLPWLSKVVDTSPSTPSTHEEIWEGATVHFRRKPQDIDLDRLERWFRGKD